MLKIKNLNLKIQNKNILENISFQIKKGEIFNILGHNGSGKTSLLKSIIGLNKSEGGIIFESENISELEISEKAEKGISYIMQEIPEYTGIKVETYLKNILEKNGKNFLEDKKFFLEIKNFFQDFGLDFEVYKERFFDSHLSGGERKKIEIITNFLMDKKLYLLDEIEASLDATSRDVLIKKIKEESKKGKTFIIVSHSKDILELAENGILLCNGKIQEGGENSILLKKYFGECDGCGNCNNCKF